MRARVAGVVCLTLAALFAADASAYCLHKYTGFKSFARFTTIPVTYRVSSNLTDSALLAAVDAAFKTWQDVACSRLAFTKGASFDAGTTQFTSPPGNEIYVFWYDAAIKTKYPIGAQFAAYTFTAHNNNGGLSYGSIALNGFATKWNATGGDAQLGVIDLQDQLIYLIGTVIGLDDSKNAAAAMNPQVVFGSTKRHTLTQDDIDAVTWLYAKDATCKAPAPGADGCSSGSPVTPPVGDAGVNPNPNADSGIIPPPTEQGVNVGDGAPASDGPPSGDGPPGDGAAPTGDGAGKSCTRNDQCGTGFVCTVEGKCVAVPGTNPGGGDSGCCNTGATAPSIGTFGLWLLALLALGSARHRRRAAGRARRRRKERG